MGGHRPALLEGPLPHGSAHPARPARPDAVVGNRPPHRPYGHPAHRRRPGHRATARRAAAPRALERPAARRGPHQPAGAGQRDLRAGRVRRPGQGVGHPHGVGLRRLRGPPRSGSAPNGRSGTSGTTASPAARPPTDSRPAPTRPSPGPVPPTGTSWSSPTATSCGCSPPAGLASPPRAARSSGWSRPRCRCWDGPTVPRPSSGGTTRGTWTDRFGGAGVSCTPRRPWRRRPRPARPNCTSRPLRTSRRPRTACRGPPTTSTATPAPWTRRTPPAATRRPP